MQRILLGIKTKIMSELERVMIQKQIQRELKKGLNERFKTKTKTTPVQPTLAIN